MEKKYRYKLDARSKKLTAAYLVLMAGAGAAYHFIWGSEYPEYLPWWLAITLLCFIILCVLSIPRYVKINSEALEIHCILDLTKINIEDVETARILGADEARSIIPLFACYGFFGYFGYFVSLREWNVYRVYTSARHGLILIEDIYEVSYVINCDDPQELIKTVLEARDKKRADIFRHLA